MELKIKKRDILKAGVELAIGTGVGIIVSNAVEMVTPDHLSKVKRISVRIGSLAVAWAITSAASQNFNQIIDDLADGIQAGYKSVEKKGDDTVHIFSSEDLSTDFQLDIPEDDLKGDDDGR